MTKRTITSDNEFDDEIQLVVSSKSTSVEYNGYLHQR